VNKAIKKKSTHRKVVSDTTYHLVLDRDITCRLRNENCKGRLELHHIIYRSEDVNLIDEPNNCIMLCTYHHKLVHSNKHKYQPILKEIIERRNNG
jgi:tRNA(His) 5'-end guanylyltransferase